MIVLVVYFTIDCCVEMEPRAPNTRPTRRAFNLDAWETRIEDTETAKLLPRAPLLRDECIFMTKNYRKIVQMRRTEQSKKQQADIIQKHFARHELPPELAQTSPALRDQSKRQRQELWLALISCSRFIAVHEKAARMNAMNTLRKLLAPVIRRVRANVRRRNRERMILAACHEEMTPPTAGILQRISPLFSGLTLESLTELASKFTPAAVSPDRFIISIDAREADICLLDTGNVELLTMQLSNYGIVELARAGELITQKHSIFGDINQAKLNAPVAVRSVGLRVLYWKLAPIHYQAIAVRSLPREILERGFAKVRERYLPLTNPPTIHGLQNCNGNTMYNDWPDHNLELLRSCLKPACFPPKHCFWSPGDEATSFFFVAEGFVDIYKRPRPTLDHEISAAALFASTEVPSSLKPETSIGQSLDHSAIFNSDQFSEALSEQPAKRSKSPGDLRPLQLRLAATCGPWKCLGVNAVVTMDRRSTRVVARTEVDCWECDRPTMLKLLANNPGLYVKVKKGLQASKLERMHDDAVQTLTPVLRNDPLFANISERALNAIAESATSIWLASHEQLRLSSEKSFIVVTRGGLSVRSANTTLRVSLPPQERGLAQLCRFLEGCGTLFAPQALNGQHIAHYLIEHDVNTTKATEMFEISVDVVFHRVGMESPGAVDQLRRNIKSRLGRDLFQIPSPTSLALLAPPPSPPKGILALGGK